MQRQLSLLWGQMKWLQPQNLSQFHLILYKQYSCDWQLQSLNVSL